LRKKKKKEKKSINRKVKSSHPSITFSPGWPKANEQKPPGIWCAGDARLKAMGKQMGKGIKESMYKVAATPPSSSSSFSSCRC
jgi:hypothetical protein